MFRDFLQDLRFGARMLRRSPTFSILAILCLTLGIGANVAVFSWMEGLMFRPFPLVAHQERIVALASMDTATTLDKGAAGDGYGEVAWPDLQDYARDCKLFDWFLADRLGGTTLNVGDRAERVAQSIVSSNYFDALGIRPILGRGFRPEEDYGRNGHPVAVISYWLWKERFKSDPNIIGRKQLLNAVPHTIIGVAPEGFYGTFVGYPIQFWAPVSMQEIFNPGGYKLEDRNQTWIEGYARLKPGVSINQAQKELSAVARRLELQYPETNRGRGAKIIPLWKNPFNQAGDLAPTLEIALVATFFVLLIACVNVGSLLLVRSLARRHEITVRLAIGSKRSRLLRQLLTEGLILSTIGGAAGLLLGYLCRNLLVVFFPSSTVLGFKSSRRNRLARGRIQPWHLPHLHFDVWACARLAEHQHRYCRCFESGGRGSFGNTQKELDALAHGCRSGFSQFCIAGGRSLVVSEHAPAKCCRSGVFNGQCADHALRFDGSGLQCWSLQAV